MINRVIVWNIALLPFALVWTGQNAFAADDLTQSIRVGPDGHFLLQPDGKPFFWLQDWAYELFKLPDLN